MQKLPLRGEPRVSSKIPVEHCYALANTDIRSQDFLLRPKIFSQNQQQHQHCTTGIHKPRGQLRGVSQMTILLHKPYLE